MLLAHIEVPLLVMLLIKHRRLLRVRLLRLLLPLLPPRFLLPCFFRVLLRLLLFLGRLGVQLCQCALHVRHQPVHQTGAEIPPHHHAQERNALRIGRHGVRGDGPAVASEAAGDVVFVVLAVVQQGEGDERDADGCGEEPELADGGDGVGEFFGVADAVGHSASSHLQTRRCTWSRSCLALKLPLALHGQACQHDGLRRAHRASSDGLFTIIQRRMEQKDARSRRGFPSNMSSSLIV